MNSNYKKVSKENLHSGFSKSNYLVKMTALESPSEYDEAFAQNFQFSQC